MTFSIGHWILKMVVLHFCMHMEDITEHSNRKCHVLYKLSYKSTQTPSVICVHLQSAIDHLCNIGIHLIALLKSHSC